MNLRDQLMRIAAGDGPSHLLTPTELAELLQISPATLRTWRCRGETHPSLAKAERWIGPQTLRYDLAQVQSYLNELGSDRRPKAGTNSNLGPGRRTPSTKAEAAPDA